MVAQAVAQELMRLVLSYLDHDHVNIQTLPDNRQLAPADGNQP